MPCLLNITLNRERPNSTRVLPWTLTQLEKMYGLTSSLQFQLKINVDTRVISDKGPICPENPAEGSVCPESPPLSSEILV